MLPIDRKLILASASPRRRELLAEAGYRFEVLPAQGVDETFDPTRETPAALVQRLAHEKAREVAEQRIAFPIAARSIVIGCDTIAECKGEVLGKPRDAADARRMLEKLSGQEHRVLSGLCLWPTPENAPLTRLAITVLHMDRLSREQLDEYLASGQWSGKAGAFGYQDRTGWLHVVAGSESNVVGLPLELLAEMLRCF